MGSLTTKYGNKKVTLPTGEVFDSKKECRRWQELKLMEQVGMISDLKRQVPYMLIPAQRDEAGKVIERECRYVADFVYRDDKGNIVVEDVKGYRGTSSAAYAKFIIKRKLMLWRYDIQIKEV